MRPSAYLLTKILIIIHATRVAYITIISLLLLLIILFFTALQLLVNGDIHKQYSDSISPTYTAGHLTGLLWDTMGQSWVLQDCTRRGP